MFIFCGSWVQILELFIHQMYKTFTLLQKFSFESFHLEPMGTSENASAFGLFAFWFYKLVNYLSMASFGVTILLRCLLGLKLSCLVQFQTSHFYPLNLSMLNKDGTISCLQEAFFIIIMNLIPYISNYIIEWSSATIQIMNPIMSLFKDVCNCSGLHKCRDLCCLFDGHEF